MNWLSLCNQKLDKAIEFCGRMTVASREFSTRHAPSGSCDAKWTSYRSIKWNQKEFAINDQVFSPITIFEFRTEMH